ncbi:MAG: molybdopterin molybdotransferase MoeA [Acidobacteriota bacterium]|nr:molybdopterin molybdotransferase MoeA [Acidobacteriota bacterium]
MISYEEALAHYDVEVGALPSETVPIELALGRVLVANVASAVDLPPFSQSAMDGYALRSADTKDATPEHPVRIDVVRSIPAGAQASDVLIEPGSAARILTGAPVPRGADAVVRQERVQRDDDGIRVSAPVLPDEDLRRRAEELTRGEIVAERGRRLTAGALAALANCGVAEVRVSRAPRVSCLVTGDELVEPGRPLESAQVYDSNRVLAELWLRERGLTDVGVLEARDERDETIARIREAFDRADLVVTTGGVSVGDRDHVIGASRAIGVREVFWRVRQKPGKPLFFGMLDEKPLVGLPGNPGSVFAGLVAHARRVLDLLEGVADPGPSFLEGRLGADVRASPRRVTWLRARIGGSGDGYAILEPLDRQGSHMISNLVRCDALARIPEGEGVLASGSAVEFVPV